MLTPTALAKVDGAADELHLTRAEVLERLVRTSSMNADTFKVEDSSQVDNRDGDGDPASGRCEDRHKALLPRALSPSTATKGGEFPPGIWR